MLCFGKSAQTIKNRWFYHAQAALARALKEQAANNLFIILESPLRA
jgi:hypothetical protein